ARSIEYLDNKLSSGGVQRLESAVKQFLRAMDAVETKWFVRWTSYIRRFDEGFGSMVAPITKLQRKDVD
ncbi:hypothetical protein PHYSODRAFT_404746, partial [Phytophthora sojae]